MYARHVWKVPRTFKNISQVEKMGMSKNENNFVKYASKSHACTCGFTFKSQMRQRNIWLNLAK